MGRLQKKVVIVGIVIALGACSKSDGPAQEDQADALETIDLAEEVAPYIEPDAPAFVGVWSADAEWCGGIPGSADPSPIAFTEGEFIGYENICCLLYTSPSPRDS